MKPLVFRLDPERAHEGTMALWSGVLRVPGMAALARAWFTRGLRGPTAIGAAGGEGSEGVEVAGVRFPNRVGLAAGFDKEGRWLREMAALGVGFVEVGTVTPRAQPGNPRPRLFRLPSDSAIINRMGFNNGGVEALAARLRHRPPGLVVGGNLGKNKDTPNEEAVADYLACFHALHQVVDYFVVNVSSPNTPGLRALQDRGPLGALLAALQGANVALPVPRPIFLKIAPDLTDAQLDDIVALVAETGIAGVIATNTTVERPAQLRTPRAAVEACGAGGLSGAPLRARSTEVVRYLHERSGGTFPIIGVGGIDSAEAAREKLAAGAVLVQVYSGLIFQGPGLFRRIRLGLRGWPSPSPQRPA
ncbi:MAG: hypothetical protein RJA19_965 [Bacteroidota bacterium]